MGTSDPQGQPPLEPLFVLNAQTKVTAQVNHAPAGDHMIFDVLSGTFEGARLRGQVPASGGDWVTRTANRSRMDVRLVLQTHDGTTILFRYSGRAHVANGQVRIEVIGSFDAPAGEYDWLNDVQAFGLGALVPEGVRYQFYRFSHG